VSAWRERLAAGRYDAVVVGSGPNGLAAALTLAEAGRSVLVLEAAATAGGGLRSAERTLPGFVHDVCSAIHPMAAGSPFFAGRELPGLEWVHPPLALAHPLEDGSAAVLERSLDATANGLGADGPAWTRAVGSLARDWPALAPTLLGPLRPPSLAMLRFGLRALRPARAFAESTFRSEPARALFAGIAAHAVLPLDTAASAAPGLVLAALGHVTGWPLARGGSQRLADGLIAKLRGLGAEILTDARVASLDELPEARDILFDVTPRQLLVIAGARLPARYRRSLGRFRYGPAAFKIDYALRGPIPWRAEACRRAGTVHLGGTLDAIASGEAAVWRGALPARPFMIVAQQSLFDPTRAPAGKHTAWAYCHVPAGSTADATEAMERELERHAPGFRDLVLARAVLRPADLEAYNANYVGGAIGGGVQDLAQLAARPTLSWNPYATPIAGLYLCSSSTPPGGGVHGMCGWQAAQAVLRRS
jgi:phytoene dehydrogenase-like protein